MSSTQRRRSGRARTDLPMNAEINVTSLVDVAFTLLVIFIITAPIMQGGLEVSLPRADVSAITQEENPLFVTVMRDGRIFLDEDEVSLEQLEAALPQMLSTGTVEKVFIQGDSLAPWGPVLQVMASTVNSGVPWAAVAEPYRGGAVGR